MSPHPTQTCDIDEEEVLHYRAMTRRLADMAMDIAAAIHAEAMAPPEPGAPKHDCTVSFERISRTLRRTLLLARRLAETLAQSRATTSGRTAARRQIIRGVEDAIQRNREEDDPDIQTLEAELVERLDRPEFDEDIATRPVKDIITDLARDLDSGFLHKDRNFGWKRRTPEDIEQLDTRAAEPLRTEPRPPKFNAAAPRPKLHRPQFPEDDAGLVAMILEMQKPRSK